MTPVFTALPYFATPCITPLSFAGRPTARVSWWKAHELLANSEARATVSFRLQRADFGTDVTCQVSSLVVESRRRRERGASTLV